MAQKKPATKPAATSKTKDKRRVDNDPLADLGLETVVTKTVAPAVVNNAVAATAQNDGADVTEAGGDEVEVGEIEFGFSDFIPTTRRKAEGSKYKFDQLPAPATDPKTGKPRIANFLVRLQPGVDPDKLRRSVQSATTQANKQGASAGKYFVSRTHTENGKFVGMCVYRTDDRPK